MKCPYCLTSFHENWHDYPGASMDGKGTHWQLRRMSCPACDELIVELGSYNGTFDTEWHYQLVKPKTISRTQISPEIPDEFSEDYKEACLVLADSSKASAALSRRCLQNILREKAGVKKGDLFDEIQQVLDAGKLPSHILGDLDAVRNIGAFAAHPIKSKSSGEIVDVEPGEAEWNLDVLESLFDYYFVAPAAAQKRRDELNKKLADVGKPPMKEPKS